MCRVDRSSKLVLLLNAQFSNPILKGVYCLQILLKILIFQLQVPHTPKGEKWYFCPHCCPGHRWNHYDKEDDFFLHTHIAPPKKSKTDKSGDAEPMDVTEAPTKLIVTYSEAAAFFNLQDLQYQEIAEKIFTQTRLPIIKCPPLDPEKRDDYVRAKTKLTQRLRDLKKKWKKNGRQIKGHEADNVLFDIVSGYLKF